MGQDYRHLSAIPVPPANDSSAMVNAASWVSDMDIFSNAPLPFED